MFACSVASYLINTTECEGGTAACSVYLCNGYPKYQYIKLRYVATQDISAIDGGE